MDTFIKVIDDVVSKFECDLFLEEFKEANPDIKKDEINFDGHQLEYTNLDKIPKLASFDLKIQDVAEKEVRKYLAQYKWANNEFYLENSMLMHIKQFQGLPLHHDNEVSSGGLRRNFIVLIYMQDLEAGELYFPQQDVLVKPKAGRMVIAPTFFTHPHMVLPTLEDRYTYRVNFFIKDRKNGQAKY